MVAWVVAFAALAAARHVTFASDRFDLGNMTQAVWNTAHGHPLEITIAQGDQISRLGSHVDPLLVLLTPLWWIWPSPLMLTTVQALALASGALPVFWLARKHTGDARSACNLALAYLLYPAVQWIAMFDFHPVTLAVPLLLFMVWFLDEDRLVAALVVGVLAMLSKEDIPLVVAGIGVWYAVRRGHRVAGGTIAVVGVAWTAVALWVIVPQFGTGTNPFYGRWESVGGSPSGMIHTLLSHPGRYWDAATTSSDLHYLFLLLVPLLGLWALEPLLALAAVPVLAMNLLSSFESMNSIQFQYVSAIVACLFAASAIGVGKLGPRRAGLVTIGVLGFVALTTLSGPLKDTWRYVESVRQPGPRLEAMRDAVRLIPPGAPVSTSNRIGAQLSERRRIYGFPVRAHADWVIVDESDPWLALAGERDAPAVYRAALARFREEPGWKKVYDEQGILVYERVAA